MKSSSSPAGIGIDAVELDRATRFCRHRRALKSFLLPREYRLFLKSRRKAQAFALLFAAKEAMSKAAAVPVTSPHQLRQFEVAFGGRVLRGLFRPARPAPGPAVAFSLRAFTLTGCVGVLAFLKKMR